MSKDLIKKHSESVAHDTAGSLIADQLIKGVPSMAGWIAALSAYLGDQPLWLIILIGSSVFLILTITWTVISSRRKPKVETRIDNGATVSNAPCKDEWLHDVAEKDRREIEWAVKLIDCDLTWNFQAVPPYLQFRFKLFNGSVYHVSIDRKINGFITYGDIRLKGEIINVSTYKAEIQPRYITYVEIRQELVEAEATLIATARDEQRFHEPHISFKQLEITIKADEGKNVIPKPVWFESISGINLDGKLR